MLDRLLRQTGFRAVVGEQRRLGRDNLRESAFEGGHDMGVELLAAAAQQGAVGGVLHQRMLEGVLGVRRRAAAEDQFGGHQPLQRIVELLLQHLRHGAYQLVRERTAERRANLGYLPRWRQSIKSGKERSVQ